MERREYERLFKLETKNWWYLGVQYLLRRSVKKHLSGRGSSKILDVGCGTGGNLLVLKEFGETCGIDVSPLAVEACRRRNLSRVRSGSILKLPYKDKHFDLAVCMSVLYHRGVGDDKRALIEIRRVLKKGGFLIGLVPALEILRGPHDKVVHTAKRYTRKEVTQLLDQAGFEEKRSSYFHFFAFPLIFVYRKLQNLFRPSIFASDLFVLPEWLNKLLLFLTKIEVGIFESIDLPIGSSVFFVAQK